MEEENCACQDGSLTSTNICAQYADVCLPMKLKPYAVVGNLETECYGEPIVSLHMNQGENCSCGCEITITQAICIKIPVKYGTIVESGKNIINYRKKF